MKDTLSFLVQLLLQKNKIKIDSNELNFQIQSHPSYPSLHAITGVLSHFDIENTAVCVPVNKEILHQLPNTFIAQIESKNNTDIVLVLNKKTGYKLIYSNKKSEIITESDFLKQFTGILVAVEKDTNKQTDQTDQTDQTSTINIQKPIFIIALVLFNVLFFKSNPSFTEIVYFLTTIIGVTISYLIIQHDLGLDSKIIDSICSQESKTTNCNAVLNSKGATLYKNIKLSDISLVYFISISIALLLLRIVNTSISSLYLISLTAFPVVIYSIYYQIKVSKNWCVLCLGIASVLSLQASIFFFANYSYSILNITSSLLIIGFSFTITSTIWLFTSSKLKQEQDFKKLKIESTKFKRNFELFNTLLNTSAPANTTIPDTPEIIFGNKKSPLNLTIITNPFCGHCKEVHNLIEQILKTHRDLLKIVVRFNVNSSNPNCQNIKIPLRLLEIFKEEGQAQCLKAMHQIYNGETKEKWLATWKDCKTPNQFLNTLDKQQKWCASNNINFTPELLINGKAYPKAYNRKDLIFFIEDLSECCIKESHERNTLTFQNAI